MKLAWRLIFSYHTADNFGYVWGGTGHTELKKVQTLFQVDTTSSVPDKSIRNFCSVMESSSFISEKVYPNVLVPSTESTQGQKAQNFVEFPNVKSLRARAANQLAPPSQDSLPGSSYIFDLFTRSIKHTEAGCVNVSTTTREFTLLHS
jgi:hypothetical protein